MNPFRYRPPEGESTYWEDNALSNALAAASAVLTPKWCQSPDHWTARVSARLFADCPCCLLMRGVVIGAVLAFLVGVLVGAML